MNYLQITGWGSPKDETAATMEVIDNFGQTRICQGSNSIYPIQVILATAIYSNGMILSCGGYVNHQPTDQCYIYEKSKGWKQLSKMNQAMYGSASIPIDGGMIVIGGYPGGNTLKSSQIIFSNGSVITDGPELPEPRYGHCLAYDKEEDVFFVTGGYYSGYKSTVWKFKDKENFILIETTQMKNTRSSHACSIVRSEKHDRRPLLVNAGGHGTGHETCEFYDFTKADSQWTLCSK